MSVVMRFKLEFLICIIRKIVSSLSPVGMLGARYAFVWFYFASKLISTAILTVV